MRRNFIRGVIIMGAVGLFVWAIINTVNSIAYALEGGDALGGLLRLGIPVLPILAYLFLVRVVSSRLNREPTPSPVRR